MSDAGKACLPGQRRGESGQALALAVLVLGIFLLGGVAFAVDIASLWFHRQAAQNAADAACTAGAMDLYLDAEGSPAGKQGFTPGAAFDCSGSQRAAPCQYAAFNGYNGANSSPGNEVSVSFPSSIPGVTAPPAALVSTPFMRVDVVDHVKVFFSALLSGKQTQDVRAFAVCGVVLAPSPIPVVVLDPTTSGSLNVQGNMTVYGGPSKGIQVNSNNRNAVRLAGRGAVDLSKGGSGLTGSDLGTFGGPSRSPRRFLGGTTGNWVAPASPVGDPFAQLATPAQPPGPQIPPDQLALGCKSIPCAVKYHDPVHGCPDPSGCDLYTPGYYPGGIAVINRTAIFDPGLYYLNGGLDLQANSTVRPSTAAGDGSGGTIFYFKGAGSISVASSSGGSTLDSFASNLIK
ncbi:MAG: pilus assembly protein TadG-related protein, partial [Terriglobia bacterium]